jgi:hypothetical protein
MAKIADATSHSVAVSPLGTSLYMQLIPPTIADLFCALQSASLPTVILVETEQLGL